ncbi:hypothetical protein Jolie2_54 [Mycobacterium phage Jolie2]|uniref:Uncharacterized protein n=1 Tax=Mycobacterium phage Jolie2 TaxID=1458831 RepID=W8E9H8_9CAUD|nr:hypothetical protein Jolie2_54 [Mycobacterium phage Jolie2]AHJ86604.1 hypothetical protein Jolie2_54 [Mycobacterium phage Jolie2]
MARSRGSRGKRGGTRKSLKKPALYDKLRAKGYSKTKAARISNAVAAGTIDHHRGRRKSVSSRLTRKKKR